MTRIKKIILIVIIFLPNFLKIILYRKLGYKIGIDVKIGISYIDCKSLLLEDGVKIGNFNIIRRLKRFEMKENSSIQNFNQFFFSGDILNSPEWCGSIILEKNVHFMSHHFIDAGGSVRVGENSIIAGRNTHVWSHTFTPLEQDLQHTRLKINIGSNVYIGARSSIFNNVPDFAIVGLGSIVNKSYPGEHNSRLLIAGNPATIKKRYLLVEEANIATS